MVRRGCVRLAGLLVGALAGCAGQAEPEVMDESYGCDQGCACTEDTAELLLARAEYEDWVADGALTTGDAVTTGAMTTGEMTTGAMTTGAMTTMATGEMTTGEMTTGVMTTGETSGTGGEPGELDAAGLTAELCVSMCKHYSAADEWGLGCSVPALTPEGEVRIVCTWTTGCE